MELLLTKIPVIANDNLTYTGVTVKDNMLYFVEPRSKQIHLFDRRYNFLQSKSTVRSYVDITYDTVENKFYFVSSNINNAIYVADENLNELDEIRLNMTEKYKDRIVGVEYSLSNDYIYVTTQNNVLAFNKIGEMVGHINSKTPTTVTMTKEAIANNLEQNNLDSIAVIHASNCNCNCNCPRPENPCNRETVIIPTTESINNRATVSSMKVPTVYTAAGDFCERGYVAYNKDESSFLARITDNRYNTY